MIADPQDILSNLSFCDDKDIDLAHAALALAKNDYPNLNLERYFHHIKHCSDSVNARFEGLINSGSANNSGTRLAALKYTMCEQEGYTGEKQKYDDLQNANLIRVIDRRKGMPIAVSILYIQVGRNLGWQIDGINMPGHFLCRIEANGERIIFDPFSNVQVLDASDIRLLLKKIKGDNAELSADYFEPISNRSILIRLQNNIKLRLIEAEDYAGAVVIVEQMRRIDPTEYRLLFDLGILYARLDQPLAAMRALQNYIDKTPFDYDKREANFILNQIRENLN